MYTVKQTALFQRKAASVLSESELDEFIDWISVHPLAGDVIPGAAPLRKVRWARAGIGKRSGARVIYFNQLENGRIVLLIVYSKSVDDKLSSAFLRKLLELEEL